MAIYPINKEGAEALQKQAEVIIKSSYDIYEAGLALYAKISSRENSLGIYANAIDALVKNNLKMLTDNKDDFLLLSDKLKEKAECILELVAMGLDNVGSSGGGNHGGNSMVGRYASKEERPKVRTRDKDEATKSGLKDIDDRMYHLRESLENEGIKNPEEIGRIIQQQRENEEIIFYNDLYGNIDDKSVESLNRLSDYFTETGWNDMTEEQREDALCTLAVDLGNAMRTPIEGISFFDGAEDGYFSGGNLHINSRVLTDPSNRVEAINAVLSTGRKAFQDAAIANPSKHGITSEQVDKWSADINKELAKDASDFATSILKGAGIV